MNLLSLYAAHDGPVGTSVRHTVRIQGPSMHENTRAGYEQARILKFIMGDNQGERFSCGIDHSYVPDLRTAMDSASESG